MNWLVDPSVLGQSAELEEAIRTVATSGGHQSDLAGLSETLVSSGGKRMRPLLTLLAATFGKETPGKNTPGEDTPGEDTRRNVLNAAAALEVVHAASLAHDDVMDRAGLRRGVASVNAAYGNTAAMLCGAYMFSGTALMFATLGDDVNRLVNAAWADLCGGQTHEVEVLFDLDLTEDEHLDVLRRKTATLFALPCLLGARLAHADIDVCVELEQFGTHVGLAFQLADDVLDLVGNNATLGKDAGNDLTVGVYTLPVLRAARSNPQLRELLQREEMTVEEVNEALRYIRNSGEVERARAQAQDCTANAVASLQHLPDTPARDSLVNLAHYAVARVA